MTAPAKSHHVAPADPGREAGLVVEAVSIDEPLPDLDAWIAQYAAAVAKLEGVLPADQDHAA